MKKTILPIVVLMLLLALAGNNYRMYQKLQSVTTPISVDAERLAELEEEKESWNARENDLLRQNGELVTQLNELKMQLNQKPTTIIKYKNNEKRIINRSASERITNILTDRYANDNP